MMLKVKLQKILLVFIFGFVQVIAVSYANAINGTFISTIKAQHSGKCLDIEGESIEKGANALQYGCNNDLNQSFEFTPVAGKSSTYTIKAQHSGQCLDVEGVSAEDGANILQWECNGDANQQFKLKKVSEHIFEIQAIHSGQCLDVFGASTADRANVIQWPCNNDQNQQWKINDSGSLPNVSPLFTSTLKAQHSDKCLDIEGESTEKGANALQYQCNNDLNQSFEFIPVVGKAATYIIKAQHSGKCLDVKSVSVEKGANVLQWECNGDDNQQFKLNEVAHQTFEIQAVHSEQCLDVFGASHSDRANVIQWPCNGDLNQYWKIDDLGSSTGRLTIAGIPKTVAYYHLISPQNPTAGGIEYLFKPRANRVNNVTFSITNMPEWASFDVKTGVLAGIPLPDDHGYYSDITISVSDGNELSTLPPFTIEVLPWQNKSFCSAKGKTDGKTYCGLTVENIADVSQCTLWVQHHWPLLNHASVRLNSASSDQEIHSIANKCDEKEQAYDEATGKCPTGYQTVSQGAFPNILTPRCMKKMTDKEMVERIGQIVEDKFLAYENERKKYPQRSDALLGFEPRKPIVTGPDENGHVGITLPPPIDLQHKLEKKKREIEQQLRDIAKGIRFQDIDTNIHPCPEIEGGSGWNKTVCFDWNKDLGQKNRFSVNAEAMGILRASGEMAGQFTLTGHVLGRAFNLVNVNKQARIWMLPGNVGSRYFTMKRNSAKESLKKITKEVDSISDNFQSLTDTVSGSGVKAQITTVGNIINKNYDEIQQDNQNLEWVGERFSKNATLWRSGPIPFSIVGIPATLETFVKGKVGMQPKASLKNILSFDENLNSKAIANASLIPKFGINTVAKAEANVIVASAGVKGSLTMIQAEIPFQASAKASELQDLPPRLQVDWQANILSGKVVAFAHVNVKIVEKLTNWLGKVFGIKVKIKSLSYEEEIYSFDGFNFGSNTRFVPIYCSRGKGCPIARSENCRIISHVSPVESKENKITIRNEIVVGVSRVVCD